MFSPLLDVIYQLITSVCDTKKTNTCFSSFTFKDDNDTPTKQVVVFIDPTTEQPYKLTLEKLPALDHKYL